MDGENGEEEFGLPGASIESEDHSDVDPFEELGIGSRTNTSSTENNTQQEYDALSDLMDGGDDEDSNFDYETVDINSKMSNDENMDNAESTYVMLLQTVWVDGILDPAEVRLLAKKRSELGISFERHLQLVDQLIG
jgi:hypothetical protein